MPAVNKREHYKRSTPAQANQQNLQISVGYELANDALLKLMNMNITVLNLSLDGSVPKIKVMYTPACTKLVGAHQFSTKNSEGHRVHGYRVMLNRCHVEWEQSATH